MIIYRIKRSKKLRFLFAIPKTFLIFAELNSYGELSVPRASVNAHEI